MNKSTTKPTFPTSPARSLEEWMTWSVMIYLLKMGHVCWQAQLDHWWLYQLLCLAVGFPDNRWTLPRNPTPKITQKPARFRCFLPPWILLVRSSKLHWFLSLLNCGWGPEPSTIDLVRSSPSTRSSQTPPSTALERPATMKPVRLWVTKCTRYCRAASHCAGPSSLTKVSGVVMLRYHVSLKKGGTFRLIIVKPWEKDI